MYFEIKYEKLVEGVATIICIRLFVDFFKFEIQCVMNVKTSRKINQISRYDPLEMLINILSQCTENYFLKEGAGIEMITREMSFLSPRCL